MDLFVKKVRESLGLNQADFGRAIGRSIQSVQAYEAGKHVPPEIEQRIRKLAGERGIGASTTGGIDERVDLPHSKSSGASARSTSTEENARWHALLDEILESGLADAVPAVQQNLITFANYVRSKAGGRLRRKSS